MYEDYMQNYLDYTGFQNYANTYDYNIDFPQYFSGVNQAGYGNYNRNTVYNVDFEELYPEIYKVIYPMVKKIGNKFRGPITRETFEDMVEEVTNNIEGNEIIELNINLNNEVKTTNNRTASQTNTTTNSKEEENRNSRQRGLVGDIVRILLIRELLRRRPCFGPYCRPGPGMPPPTRPPYPRYEF